MLLEIAKFVPNREIDLTNLYKDKEEFDKLLKEFFDETEYLFS